MFVETEIQELVNFDEIQQMYGKAFKLIKLLWWCACCFETRGKPLSQLTFRPLRRHTENFATLQGLRESSTGEVSRFDLECYLTWPGAGSCTNVQASDFPWEYRNQFLGCADQVRQVSDWWVGVGLVRRRNSSGETTHLRERRFARLYESLDRLPRT